jgi:hypothetical protein
VGGGGGKPIPRASNSCPDSGKFYGYCILKTLLIQEISYVPIKRLNLKMGIYILSVQSKKLAVLGLNLFFIFRKKIVPESSHFFD